MSALTLDQAQKIISAALAHSKSKGYKAMGIVVLDEAGHLKAFAREDAPGEEQRIPGQEGRDDQPRLAEDDDEEDDGLEEALAEDVLGHLARDDVLVLAVGRALEQLVLGFFGREGEGGEGVHDEVDPEQLDSLQRSALCNGSTHNDNYESHHVDGKLELKETLDVIEDVPTPHAGLHD